MIEFDIQGEADSSIIFKSKKKAEAEYLKSIADGAKDKVSGLQTAFKGYLPSCSLTNETHVWMQVHILCGELMARYQTSLHEDIELLAKDDKENTLGFNKRNCILYRKGEKEVLQYLVDCAMKVVELLNLSRKNAHKEIEKWGEGSLMKKSSRYFTDTLVPLIGTI